MAADDNPEHRIRVWDLPVRVVHWSFVALVPALWWTGEQHDIARHTTIGLAMLALVTFRILWGLSGSATARFAQFLKGPRAIAGYLRGAAPPAVGHNPLGGWSVIAMLGLVTLVIGFGLIAQDVDGLESGPLSYLVDYETADAAREWHEAGFNILLALIALHIGAIFWFQFVKRRNLVMPMLTGQQPADKAAAQPARAAPAAAVVLTLIAAALAWWISLGAPIPGPGLP